MPTRGSGESGSGGKVIKRATPGTIQDKFLVGYQGWFTCGGDGAPIGEGHHGWQHWLNAPLPANGRINTDLWPDTSAYEESELYVVEGLKHKNGDPAKVFSSRDPRTVRRHFHWMAEYGVDGAFLQRFVGQVDPEWEGNRDERFGGLIRLRDEVGRRVREAAEAEGRVWAIMYDASGVPADKVLRIVTQDFTHLLRDERILDSPFYLHERNRPVIALWGFGLSDSPVSPQLARQVFDALRRVAFEHCNQEIYIFAGTAAHWRTPGQGDAHADPGWEGFWVGKDGAVDAVSPWSVGRFTTAVEVEAFARDRWGPDADMIAAHNEGLELNSGGGRRVDYLPVVLPGGSGFNLSHGKWSFNGIKRNGGKFLWSQIFHTKRLKGVRSLYGAMWDEYDEGTAFLPVVEKKRQLPEHETFPFLSLDEDGYDIPSDWFMRIAGFAAEGLRSERRIHDTFPSKELQDFWSTRPKYEDESTLTSSSSALGAGASSSSSSGLHASSSYSSSAGMSSSRSGAGGSNGVPAASAAQSTEETEAERRAREAKEQFDVWAEEQRRKEAEGEEMPPPAYSLEDEGPGLPAEAASSPQPVQQQAPVQQQQQERQPTISQQQQQQVPIQQQPVQEQRPISISQEERRASLPQQRPVLAQQTSFQQHSQASFQQQGPVPQQDQQQDQYSPPQPQAPTNDYGGNGRPVSGAEPVVDALASDLGRARLTTSPPPLHPSRPARPSSGGPAQQGYGRVGAERPPMHPAHPQAGRLGSQSSVHTLSSGGSGGDVGAAGAGYDAAGRVASPEVQGGRPYGTPQHTGGPSASPGNAPYPQHQNSSAGTYPPPGSQPQWQQQNVPGSGYQQAQHTGGSTRSSGSAYPPPQPPRPTSTHSSPAPHAAYGSPAGPPQAHAPYGQSPPPAGGSGSSAPYAHGGSQPQQPQHTGGSASSYNPAGAYPPHQQHAYQQPQHSGGSSSSTSSYPPPQPPRPASAYPGQAGGAGYTPPSGPQPPHGHAPYAGGGSASGAGLGHSVSLSAKPNQPSYPGAAYHQSQSYRPDSAPPRPPASGYAPYPASSGSGAAYPSPSPAHGPPPSLAPRPDSVRHTTPGYGGGPHADPMQPSYPNQYPSQNTNLPYASQPGSSYSSPGKLPSPDLSGPAFPGASQYGAYNTPPQSPSFGGQAFPGPQPGGYMGGPSYPPAGPSFPHVGPDNGGYSSPYQDPQGFPGAGYSSPYNNDYSPQPQGPWVPGGGPPPPMPHRPGSLPQPSYGQQPYGGPTNFPSPPSSGPTYGLDPLDKIVGRRTREQLEGAVDSIAQSSTKLFNKFR
ncbi:hypothetical protein R3P38DRAFT_2895265 [Favolaschia claudopus]|uniref:Uncharacterized protein n=1 Tax=Favolaschia claudopus TaxID=2862362 RepID=A0AAW0CLM0_9AGAR